MLHSTHSAAFSRLKYQNIHRIFKAAVPCYERLLMSVSCLQIFKESQDAYRIFDFGCSARDRAQVYLTVNLEFLELKRFGYDFKNYS
jgi:hypothetical protein